MKPSTAEPNTMAESIDPEILFLKVFSETKGGKSVINAFSKIEILL